jgi:hypothetical protein
MVNLWDDSSVENCIRVYSKLKEYIDVANKMFYETPNIEFLKKFALITYYDVENKSLLKSDEINRKASHEYVLDQKKNGEKILEGNNLHYWNNSFYFVEDDKYEKEVDKKLKSIKLHKLKLLYDFYIQGMIDLEKELNKGDYNECWLKYAYNDNDKELFVQHLMFENNKVKIDSKLGDHSQSNIRNYINFFAYRYLKEKARNGWIVNKYSSYVYDPMTVNVRDTLFMSKIVDFTTIERKKIINASELKIIWQDQHEMRLDNRSFFYIMQKRDFVGDSDTLIEFDGNKIIKRIFNYSDYKEITIDLNPDIETINYNRENESECRNSILTKYCEYVNEKKQYDSDIKEMKSRNEMNITDEKMKEIYNQFRLLLNENFKVVNSYYKNEAIVKYVYILKS